MMNALNALTWLIQLLKTLNLNGSKPYVYISYVSANRLLFVKINDKFRGSCHKLSVEVFQNIYNAVAFWQMDVS